MIYSGAESLRHMSHSDISVMRSLDVGHKQQIGAGFLFKLGAGAEFEHCKFPYYSICYVIEGTGQYRDQAGNGYDLAPGSLFQRFPDREHSTSVEHGQKWAVCYLDFDRKTFDFFTATGVINPDYPCLHGLPSQHIEQTLFELMQELKQCPQARLPDLLLQAATFLRKLQQQYLRQGEHSSDFIQLSCIYFLNNYQQRFDLQEYCLQHGKGYEWFRKAFKQSVGVSPRKYIIHRRMEVACQYLRYTTDSISQIAHELGYLSPSDFSAQFKSTLGSSPQFYRQRHKTNPNTN